MTKARQRQAGRRLRAWTLALALALAGSCAPALAASCLVSTGALAFGNYQPSALADATTNLQVSCSSLFTEPVAYTILLSAGGSASYVSRTLSGPGQLHYNLYTNAGHAVIWGDGTAGSSVISDGYTVGGLLVVRTYPVYGRVPGGQNVPAGIYTDSITVTLNY